MKCDKTWKTWVVEPSSNSNWIYDSFEINKVVNIFKLNILFIEINRVVIFYFLLMSGDVLGTNEMLLFSLDCLKFFALLKYSCGGYIYTLVVFNHINTVMINNYNIRLGFKSLVL